MPSPSSPSSPSPPNSATASTTPSPRPTPSLLDVERRSFWQCMHLNRQIRLESLSLFFSTKLFVLSARSSLDAFMTGLTPEALKHVQRITVTDFKFTDRWRIIGGTEGTGGEDTVHGLRLLASRCTNLKGLTVRGGGCLMAELSNSDVSRVGRVVRRLPSASELLSAFPVIIALLEVRGLAKVELDLSAGRCGGCAKHVKAQELYGRLKEAVEQTLILPREEKDEGDADGAGEGG
ncbi:hypothetical protein LTS18_006390 [Coniosporium uncinatum]|uniref:Uncharacterized protein n=1 Tax=Coniosporium uncinatum TaxID=93489 RepID=A0ACC3DB61_9PEZI|nr:hypothetical protein LTS18_006390 [Coniosporium uncinatum]